MIYSVIPMFGEGVRLEREVIAAAAPVIGDLQIKDWVKGNSERRILRQAVLVNRRTDNLVLDLLVPLFDPVIIRMTPRWFVLRGYQYGVGRAQFMQEWLVRSVEDVKL